MNLDDDIRWMRLALEQAQAAAQAGEVPVGAVVVRAGQLIATGRNSPINAHDPTAHAEIVALRAAAQQLGNYRLEDCTLYVTLEPCAMCSGAMLHARLPRVVFGAADAKTGVAGSVLNLFAQTQLNHHTQVQGGVLASDCAQLLGDFFKQRRRQQRMVAQAAYPLRDDALRTPEPRFTALADFLYSPHYCNDLPALAGLRLHYWDEGPSDAAITWLCLHSSHHWGYSYRHLLPALTALGQRVLVPDLIGFGRSDKPKKERWHRPAQHLQILSEWLQSQSANPAHWVLVTENPAPDWAALFLTTLPPLWARRCVGQLVLDESPALDQQAAAWQAPFPDQGFRAGPRAWAGWSVPSEAHSSPHVALPMLAGQARHAEPLQATNLARQAVEYFGH